MLASRLWGWAGLWCGLYVVPAIIETARDIATDKGLKPLSISFWQLVTLRSGLLPPFREMHGALKIT
jgi:hypothetical protein